MKFTKSARWGQTWRVLVLLFTALLWGSTFVAQIIGAEHVGAFTYLAGRTWIGVAALTPIMVVVRRNLSNSSQGLPQRQDVLKGCISCGIFLFLASFVQQTGIAYTTAAKCGFLTAMYVVFVPILAIFLGQRPNRRIWICIALMVVGLYLLCMQGSLVLSYGDSLSILSGLLFALQIMSVSKYVTRVNGIILSYGEFLTEAILATICMFIFENPTMADIRAALPAIAYAGIFSTGVAYTLQAVAQNGLRPEIASLAMCMESVFSAICGWLILGQALSAREMVGSGLMFVAIVLSQLIL